MAFERRKRDDPTSCGCPLMPSACGNAADGEDRLCTLCRESHRPDFIPRAVIGDESDAELG